VLPSTINKRSTQVLVTSNVPYFDCLQCSCKQARTYTPRFGALGQLALVHNRSDWIRLCDRCYSLQTNHQIMWSESEKSSASWCSSPTNTRIPEVPGPDQHYGTQLSTDVLAYRSYQADRFPFAIVHVVHQRGRVNINHTATTTTTSQLEPMHSTEAYSA
jgi:hypothetical protein